MNAFRFPKHWTSAPGTLIETLREARVPTPRLGCLLPCRVSESPDRGLLPSSDSGVDLPTSRPPELVKPDAPSASLCIHASHQLGRSTPVSGSPVVIPLAPLVAAFYRRMSSPALPPPPLDPVSDNPGPNATILIRRDFSTTFAFRQGRLSPFVVGCRLNCDKVTGPIRGMGVL